VAVKRVPYKHCHEESTKVNEKMLPYEYPPEDEEEEWEDDYEDEEDW